MSIKTKIEKLKNNFRKIELPKGQYMDIISAQGSNNTMHIIKAPNKIVAKISDRFEVRFNKKLGTQLIDKKYNLIAKVDSFKLKEDKLQEFVSQFKSKSGKYWDIYTDLLQKIDWTYATNYTKSNYTLTIKPFFKNFFSVAKRDNKLYYLYDINTYYVTELPKELLSFKDFEISIIDKKEVTITNKGLKEPLVGKNTPLPTEWQEFPLTKEEQKDIYPFIDVNNPKFELNGAYFNNNKIVATNTLKLIIIDKKHNLNAIIPKKVFKNVITHYNYTDPYITVKYSNGDIYRTSKIKGNYFDVNRLTPMEFKGVEANFDVTLDKKIEDVFFEYESNKFIIKQQDEIKGYMYLKGNKEYKDFTINVKRIQEIVKLKDFEFMQEETNPKIYFKKGNKFYITMAYQ